MQRLYFKGVKSFFSKGRKGSFVALVERLGEFGIDRRLDSVVTVGLSLECAGSYL
jgi:hypothetical protein